MTLPPDAPSTYLPDPAIEIAPAGWSRSWPVVVLASTIAVAVVSLLGAPEIVRGPITVWFIAFCPGMAVVRLLRLDDPIAEVMLAFALSLALAGLVPSVFLYLDAWSAGWSLAVLVAITAVGLALDPVSVSSRQRSRAGRAGRQRIPGIARQARPTIDAPRPAATGRRSARGSGTRTATSALNVRRLPPQGRPMSAEERSQIWGRTLGSDPLVEGEPTAALRSAFDHVIGDIADRRRRGD